MEQTTEKLCTNCKHFIQHYIIFKDKLKETFCGHCVKDINNLNRIHKRIINKQPCEFWESGENIKEERKRLISNEISRMCKLLESISLILNVDE